MKTKYKILITLFGSILLVLGYGITYSFYNSDADLSGEKDIAKFIFNAENSDQIQLSLIDLKPGTEEEYLFSVSNYGSDKTSNVSLHYQMTIKTYHFIPLIIELYKIEEETESLLLTCDETYERNLNNEIECTTSIQEMEHSLEKKDDYKLKINFPPEYNDEIYADLVDYIDMEIISWQKIQD